MTWATGIDEAGRPIEAPGARYAAAPFETWPAALGAHNWLPMSYDPKAQLAFVPVADFGATYSDAGASWRPSITRVSDGALLMTKNAQGPGASGRLVAWSPGRRKALWSVSYPTFLNGGVMSTAGGLVFQGSIDGHIRAFAAPTGRMLWDYDARAPILATPISYSVNGRQFVTVLTGLGMGYSSNAAALLGEGVDRFGYDPRTSPRRILTFAIGGRKQLPPRPPVPPAFSDPDYRPDASLLQAGAATYHAHCSVCHGSLVVGTSHAPDLRRSPIPPSADTFAAIVHAGALENAGMPRFAELTAAEVEAVRLYVRHAAANLRQAAQGAGQH